MSETEFVEMQKAVVGAEDEADRLREIIKRLTNHDWIIGTAYHDQRRDFGWQVNVRDEPSKKKGVQTYAAVRDTFALGPVEAGLLGLELASAVRSTGTDTPTEGDAHE